MYLLSSISVSWHMSLRRLLYLGWRTPENLLVAKTTTTHHCAHQNLICCQFSASTVDAQTSKYTCGDGFPPRQYIQMEAKRPSAESAFVWIPISNRADAFSDKMALSNFMILHNAFLSYINSSSLSVTLLSEGKTKGMFLLNPYLHMDSTNCD